jgi:glycosyltransferase involved in cell wall biosynthesis
MSVSPVIAVILPCYNEEAAIAQTVAGFRAALPSATVYVYDNNSRDRTVDIAHQAGAIVRTERQQGKGSCRPPHVRRCRRGRLCHGRRRPDLRSPGSARNGTDAGREQLDMVVGIRQHAVADAYRGGHVFGNRLFTGLLARLFGRSFTDIFSGYRVFSRRFVKSFPVLSEGFEIETEISVHALELRMPVGELLTTYGARPEGSASKLSTYRDGWRILKTIGTSIAWNARVFLRQSRCAARDFSDHPRCPACADLSRHLAWCRASRPRSW